MKTVVIRDIVGVRATDMKQGDKVYKLILEGFKNNESVCVDFGEMNTILSIFLNNAIGTLYKDYKSDYLNKNLKVTNLNEYNLFILKRVIDRAKDFYSNPKFITNILDEKFSDEVK